MDTNRDYVTRMKMTIAFLRRQSVTGQGTVRLTVFHIQYVAFPCLAVMVFALIAKLFGIQPGNLAGTTCLFFAMLGRPSAYSVDHWANESTYKDAEKMSNEQLRAYLNNGNWHFIHVIYLLQLAVRGEDTSDEKRRVLQLLESEDEDKRIHALDAIRLVYPDLVEKLGDYEPREPLDICHAKVSKITNATAEGQIG